MSSQRTAGECGYAMVALLVGLSIMALVLSIALPSWQTMAQREREEELIFRGEQYARAIALYQRRYANAFPPNFDVLVDQRFLRRKYKDPMTKDGEFQPIFAGQALPGTGSASGPAGQGPAAATNQTNQLTQGVQQPQGPGRAGGAPVGAGLLGVVSKSPAASLRIYNGRTKYNEWAFVATQAATTAGAPTGAQRPGGPGAQRPGGPGGRGGPGGVGRPGGPGQQPGTGRGPGNFPRTGGGGSPF